MHRVLLLLFLLCGSRAVQAQEKPGAPARLLTRVPFHQFTGGVIVFQARLSDFPDTLNFILDSGSGGISLDSLTALSFGLEPVPSTRTIRGIGGTKLVSFLHHQSLKLPGLSVDSLSFHINDYSLLNAVYGEKIDGIVGYSLLSRYIVKVNYDSSWMDIYTKGDMRYPRGGHLLHPQINTLPVQPLRVRDRRTLNARFLYDMGAGLNMLLSTSFLNDSGLLRKDRRFFAKEAEGLGGKVDMNLTILRDVRIGPYKFRNVPVYVFDDIYNVTAYPNLGGLLGSDLLRRFNATINYERGEIHLLPNSHFDDPFDYGYCGVELYLIEGRIVIGDVARNSPAEKAGMLEGDIVVAINKNFTQNLTLYKAMLQQPNERIDLVYTRNGELRSVSFMVKSIL
jgi:hypothetical protein